MTAAVPSMAVPAPRWLLILGWVLAFLGGAIGIVIGAHLRMAKITDLDGKSAPRYDQSARTQGLYIMILGAVMLVVWTIANIAMK